MKKRIIGTVMTLALLFGMTMTGQAHEPWSKQSKTKTAVKIGAGAGVGAGLGALIGGGRGAAAGALIGGGVMTADSMAKRDSGYGKGTRSIGTVIAGTAVGTGLGAAIGGKKGAGIGALIGGGGSAVYALT